MRPGRTRGSCDSTEECYFDTCQDGFRGGCLGLGRFCESQFVSCRGSLTCDNQFCGGCTGEGFFRGSVACCPGLICDPNETFCREAAP